MSCGLIAYFNPLADAPDAPEAVAPAALAVLPDLEPLPEFGGVPDVPDPGPAVEALPAVAVSPVAVDSAPWLDSETNDVVGSVMSTVGDLAVRAQAQALGAISALAAYAPSIDPMLSPVLPVETINLPAPSEAPEAPNLTADFGLPPDAPSTGPAVLFEVPAPPLFDVNSIQLLNPQALNPFTAVMPDAPSLEVPAAPVEPDFVLPEVPTLLTLAIPDMPAIDLPVLALQLKDTPELDEAPFAYAEAQYQSTLLADMHARLAASILDQSQTGLREDVEQIILERAADREAWLTHQATGEALRMLQARGFAMPAAALVRIVQQALQDSLNRTAGLYRDVAIARANLCQSNLRFTLEQGVTLENRMIDKANAAAVRALDAAKATVKAEINLFNARVALFGGRIAALQAQAEVFKAQLTAALAPLEVYKLQIEAQRTLGSVNESMLQVYQARIAGIGLIVDSFKTRVGAASAMIEVQQGEVLAHRARVSALQAQVQTKEDDWKVYATHIKAQAAQVEQFSEEIDGFKTQVGAFDALVKAKIGVATLAFKQQSEFPLDLYSARIDAYKTGTQATLSQLRASASVFGAEIRAFEALEGSKSAHLAATLKVANANAQSALAQADINIQAGSANLSVAEVAMATAQTNVRTVGQLAGQLAAAAVAAQSVHASINETGGMSLQQSENNSASNASNVSASNSFDTSSSMATNNSVSTGLHLSNSRSSNTARTNSKSMSNSSGSRASISNTKAYNVQNSDSLSASKSSSTSLDRDCTDITTYSD